MRNFARLAILFGAVALAFADEGRTIQVDVSYTGSGKVDASHKVWVFLWDSPDMGNSPPVDTKTLDAKTGTVTFTNVQTVPGYVSVAYDPSGSWAADSAPPSGTSLGVYSKEPPTPAPIDVKPGQTTKVKVEFDDSFKMP